MRSPDVATDQLSSARVDGRVATYGRRLANGADIDATGRKGSPFPEIAGRRLVAAWM
jgi:hypothetical protein